MIADYKQDQNNTEQKGQNTQTAEKMMART